MAFSLLENRGTALDRQHFKWRELVPPPISKLDDDAFTRVRVILMQAVEMEALRFSHSTARHVGDLRLPLAEVRRVEQHQATLVNSLLGADHSPLETTIAYEQAAIELTAALARREPDPYLAQNYRFGMLEACDHLYRFAALLDRLHGMDANNILQCYTDILPGRATAMEHRAPADNLRRPYDRSSAHVLSKLHALTLTSTAIQTHDYYMTVGPQFADPLARQLYAEIASIEEQHVTQYESLLDPTQTPLEDWLLHEANEAYLYHSCTQQESNPRIRTIWERLLDYELGHFHMVAKLLQKHEGRDLSELIPGKLPDPFPFESNREFVRETLLAEVDLRADGGEIVDLYDEPQRSIDYRDVMNTDGSPSDRVAENYRWTPGTELNRLDRVA